VNPLALFGAVDFLATSTAQVPAAVGAPAAGGLVGASAMIIKTIRHHRCSTQINDDDLFQSLLGV
jgi:hypothetical protein